LFPAGRRPDARKGAEVPSVTPLRLSLLAISAVALALAAPPASATAHHRPLRPEPAGAVLGVNGDTLDRQALALARSEGVTVARIDASWAETQGDPGEAYNWSWNDSIYRMLRSLKLQWHVIAGGAPLWAGGVPPMYFPDPQHVHAYATYAAALAARYRPPYLEVGNEPDSSDWATGYPSPAQYASMLRAVRIAVKRASPTTKVLNGGTASQEWADSLYRLAKPLLADGVNIHTYACPPTIAVWALDVSKETGYPVVDTEYGWASGQGDTLTPSCNGLDRDVFYHDATAALLKSSHVELAEPFIWAGTSSQLTRDVESLRGTRPRARARPRRRHNPKA
jgi:hypothetical protein